ncbi:MAG: hypothetical protein Q4B28_06485 [bacterium]|nr:hypothetical protein [bacterium]
MKQAEENAKTECAYKWLSSSSSYSPQVIVISPFEDQDFYSTSDRTHWLYHSQRAIEFKDEGKYDRVIEELQESLKYLKHNGQLYQDTKLLLQHAEIKQGFIELDIWFKKYTEERDQGIYYAEKGYYESALPYFIQAKHHAKEYEQVCKKLS